jgi:acyl-CoA thioesterase-1
VAKAGLETTITVLALGDSLTAGYGVQDGASLPDVLERMLAEEEINVRMINAGVSGDTASGGLARLPGHLGEPLDAAIVEFGTNDAFMGLDLDAVREALEEIVVSLKERGVEVMLAGARAFSSFGGEYAASFERLYPDLADEHGLVLYPFILDGVLEDRANVQWDGLHPNERGVEVMAKRMLPLVRELVGRARNNKGGART